MFITSQYLLTVICLTIVTLTRSLPAKNDSFEISGALSGTFLQKYTNDTKHYCPQVDLNRYNDKFNRIYYACMELYDVTLQLCESKKDIKSYLGNVPKAKDFCKELKFYDKRAESIENWADTAVTFLSNSANCERVCISDNSVHPICEAIYLGNTFLIKAAEERPSPRIPIQHVDVSATVLPKSNPIPPEIQPNSQRDALHDKELLKSVNVKPEKPKEPKEERKPNPVNSLEIETNGKLFPEERTSDVVKEGDNLDRTIVDRKGEEESIPAENVLPVEEAKSDIEIKPMAEVQPVDGDQQFPEEKPADGIQQIFKKQPSEVSQSLAPAIAVPSVTSSAGPESIYKDSADERDDAPSKDGDLESDGDIGFKEDPVSQVIGNTREDSPIMDVSGEPEENIGITGNKFSSRFPHAQDSHFFAYFLTMVVICIIGYLVFHNKQKIIALALEGRRMQGSRRRPNTSSYKKLDSNLEEAVTSNCSSTSVTHVIF